MATLTKDIKNIDVETSMDELGLNKDSDREQWVLILLRGIALVLFGMVSIAWPGITLVALAWVFAVFIMVIGTLDIINGFRMFHAKNLWFLKVLLGVVEIGVAMYLLRSGFVVTTLIFLQTVGLIMILQAVIDTVVVCKGGLSKGLVALTLISALFGFIVGVFLLREPAVTGLTFVWILGFYGVVVGAITIASSFAVRPSKNAK